jgi:hypothetical protein
VSLLGIIVPLVQQLQLLLLSKANPGTMLLFKLLRFMLMSLQSGVDGTGSEIVSKRCCIQ